LAVCDRADGLSRSERHAEAQIWLVLEPPVERQVFVTPARGAERFRCIDYGLPAPEICGNCEQLKGVLTVLCLTKMG
jgi:hypothetical protein